MKWWQFVILAVIIAIIAWVIIDNNRPSFNITHSVTQDTIPQNPWTVVTQADPSELIKVTWDQKYGSTVTQYCKVVFQSAAEYKLVAPWANVLIEKENLNNINFSKEPFDSSKINSSH